MTAWTHKVVKRQRGENGKWYNGRGVGYKTRNDAVGAGFLFAQDLLVVGALNGGTEIDVKTRKGDKVIVTFRRSRLDPPKVEMLEWE